MDVAYADGRLFHVPAADPVYATAFAYESWEPGESAAIPALIEPGDFVIDIGANYGWFTLLMAGAVGASGRVVAIEPWPQTCNELRRNVTRNGFASRVQIHEVAVSDSSGTVSFNLFAELPHGHASMSTLGRRDFVSQQVRALRLDDLVDPEEHGAPTVIKIDVEGAERLALEGARGVLSTGPMLTLEVNYDTSAAFGYRPIDLLTLLGEHGLHNVFRVGSAGRVSVEREPLGAPSGTTWLVVPDTRLDRVSELVDD